MLLRRIYLTCYKFVVDVFGRSYLSAPLTDRIARNMTIGTFGANAFRIGKVNRALLFFKGITIEWQERQNSVLEV